jgi:AcrR family transcriptional regulator
MKSYRAGSSDKRLRIMQAAEKLFSTRQFHEISLEEVARVADVGKGTIYLYFSDKEDLFYQTAVSGYDDMCKILQNSAIERLSFRDILLRTCVTISDFFRRRRPLFRVILSERARALESGGGLGQRWVKHRKSMREAVAAIIARGIESGEVQSGLPPEVLAEYLLGMIRTRAWELEDQPDAVRTDASIVELFIHGAVGRVAREFPAPS